MESVRWQKQTSLWLQEHTLKTVNILADQGAEKTGPEGGPGNIPQPLTTKDPPLPARLLARPPQTASPVEMRVFKSVSPEGTFQI